MVEKIKKPLLKAIVNLPTLRRKKEILTEVAEIIRLCNLYPEPTHENVSHPNAHRAIDIRDEFLEHDDNPSRKALFEVLFKVWIVTIEHDSFHYGRRGDRILKGVCDSRWEFDPIGPGDKGWKEGE